MCLYYSFFHCKFFVWCIFPIIIIELSTHNVFLLFVLDLTLCYNVACCQVTSCHVTMQCHVMLQCYIMLLQVVVFVCCQCSPAESEANDLLTFIPSSEFPPPPPHFAPSSSTPFCSRSLGTQSSSYPPNQLLKNCDLFGFEFCLHKFTTLFMDFVC